MDLCHYPILGKILSTAFAGPSTSIKCPPAIKGKQYTSLQLNTKPNTNLDYKSDIILCHTHVYVYYSIFCLLQVRITNLTR